ncbi:hypothetical protein H4R34_005065 [Dimargaris verticillata]|uniref:F-box domain-containing protein n=1 Tax=Dimargaris verticillata TaxID=2761393 RepID=A0A9W8B2Z8_9FUNG|nr:hypothetical protein H4R34_005065 [Dimargaris verticillata]
MDIAHRVMADTKATVQPGAGPACNLYKRRKASLDFSRALTLSPTASAMPHLRVPDGSTPCPKSSPGPGFPLFDPGCFFAAGAITKDWSQKLDSSMLPSHIWCRVFQHLPSRTLITLTEVNRTWQSLIVQLLYQRLGRCLGQIDQLLHWQRILQQLYMNLRQCPSLDQTLHCVCSALLNLTNGSWHRQPRQPAWANPFSPVHHLAQPLQPLLSNLMHQASAAVVYNSATDAATDFTRPVAPMVHANSTPTTGLSTFVPQSTQSANNVSCRVLQRTEQALVRHLELLLAVGRLSAPGAAGHYRRQLHIFLGYLCGVLEQLLPTLLRAHLNEMHTITVPMAHRGLC